MTGTVRNVGPASIIDDVATGNPASLGDKLGLAGMLEADRIELFLGHRPSDDRRQPNRNVLGPLQSPAIQ